MNKKKILVIDDEREIGELFQNYFSPRYSVLTARSGPAGISCLKSKKPDLIFLDIKMPVMDGVATLEKIRAFDKKVKVVMLTAYGTPETVRNALDLSVYEYVTKPFDLKLVNEKVYIRVVAELPGVAEEEIKTELAGDILTITTTGERKYAKETLLSAVVKPESMNKTFKNGILEIRFEKR